MAGTIPLIHGSDGDLNDALATAAGVPRSLHAAGYTPAGRSRTNWGEVPPRLDDASLKARERLHRVAQAPLPDGVRPWREITCTPRPPQPEGTPAMNENQPDEVRKDQSTFPALLDELEELNSEVQCELQCLDGALDRLGADSQPQGSSGDNKAEATPETHLARLHHQIIRLRNLRDETRELNRRLAEAV